MFIVNKGDFIMEFGVKRIFDMPIAQPFPSLDRSVNTVPYPRIELPKMKSSRIDMFVKNNKIVNRKISNPLKYFKNMKIK